MLHYPYYIPSLCSSSATVATLVRMGRKLKLSVHQKNEEREKRAAKKLHCKIPLCALNLPCPSNFKRTVLSCVSPTAYIYGGVCGICTSTFTLTSKSRVVTKWFVHIIVMLYFVYTSVGWIDASDNLVLCKLSCENSPQVLYSLTVYFLGCTLLWTSGMYIICLI